MSNIVSIILIIASFGLFFGYVDPTWGKIQADKAEKSDYDRALNNSKQLESERDKLLEKFNAMPKEDLDKLVKLLPDNIDNIRLAIDMDEMAKTYGMRIRNFHADTNDKQETLGKDTSIYGTLTMSFSTTAPYNTFLAFMHDLERSLRVLDITSVSFAANDQNPLYDYSVTLKTYWLK